MGFVDKHDDKGRMISNSSQHASLSNDEANHAGSFLFKPFLTFDDQVEHLIEQGFSIDDRKSAVEALSSLNYYRLRAYWMTLDVSAEAGDMIPFRMVLDISMIDDAFRLWLWSSIAPIELKLRSQFAYCLGENCGPDAHLHADNFRDEGAYRHSYSNYARECAREKKSGVPCVIHNLHRYGELPIWSAVEVMSFGTLSSLYGNLINDGNLNPGSSKAVGDIARSFGVRPSIAKSWMQHLSMIRNICGHHARFYNRVMKIRPKMLRQDSQWASDKEFPTFLVIKRLYEHSWPERWAEMASELGRIVDRYPSVDLAPMGFPKTWREVLGVPKAENGSEADAWAEL